MKCRDNTHTETERKHHHHHQPGIEPTALASPAMAGGFSTTEPPRRRFLHVHEKGSNYLRKNSYGINSYSILGYSYPSTNLGLWILFK